MRRGRSPPCCRRRSPTTVVIVALDERRRRPGRRGPSWCRARWRRATPARPCRSGSISFRRTAGRSRKKSTSPGPLISPAMIAMPLTRGDVVGVAGTSFGSTSVSKLGEAPRIASKPPPRRTGRAPSRERARRPWDPSLERPTRLDEGRTGLGGAPRARHGQGSQDGEDRADGGQGTGEQASHRDLSCSGNGCAANSGAGGRTARVGPHRPVPFAGGRPRDGPRARDRPGGKSRNGPS